MRDARHAVKGPPWHDRLVLLLGLWLFASPFALGVPSLSHPSVVAAYVCGVVLVGSAAEASSAPDAIERWVALATGASLASTPWLLDYTDEEALTINAVAVGALVAVCGALGLLREALAAHGKDADQIGSGS
jgi:hypothetical protein